MVLSVHRNQAYSRRGEGGEGGMEVGEEGILYTCHHQNDSCVKAEADSNRDHSAYQPNALLLGQTSSQLTVKEKWCLL